MEKPTCGQTDVKSIPTRRKNDGGLNSQARREGSLPFSRSHDERPGCLVGASSRAA